MRKAEVGVMHFGSGGEPQTKECRWSLEAEKGKKKDLLLEPLIPAQRGLFWTFLFQDCKIINMCCFQTLSVWQFVPHYGVSFLTVVPCEPHGWYLLSGIGPSHALLPGTYRWVTTEVTWYQLQIQASRQVLGSTLALLGVSRCSL